MITTMYLHGNKEDNIEVAKEIGLKEECHTNFMYALYEVAFEVDIDEDTGEYEILTVDGRNLERKVK